MIDDGARASRLGDRVELHRRRPAPSSSSTEPVDAVFSNATFHWILDHELLFGRLHAALRPGGALDAQCGGEGNVAEWTRAVEAVAGDERFAAYLRGIGRPWNFASAGRDRGAARAAPASRSRCWLEDSAGRAAASRAAFLRAVGLAAHLDRASRAICATRSSTPSLGSMPRPLALDYVRLNIVGAAGRPR